MLSPLGIATEGLLAHTANITLDIASEGLLNDGSGGSGSPGTATDWLIRARRRKRR